MPTPENESTRHWAHVIGQRIQAAREATGLSRTQLARLLGSTPGTLSRIEQGTHPRVALHFLAVIADVLRVPSLDALLAPPASTQDPPEATPEVTPAPRMPRFPMPLLPVPSWPDVPAAGTRLTPVQVQEIHDRLMRLSVAAVDASLQLSDAWEAHHTQYGRIAPELVIPLHRRTRRRTRRPETDA